jgi:PAS domain S-box-containing protein
MFGRNSREMVGQPIDALMPERFRSTHRRSMSEFGARGTTHRVMGLPGQVVGVRASGEEFPLEASISRIVANDELILTVILRDVSERVQAERQREQLEAQLRQSQKIQSLGTLTGGIAHDFNNILTAIAGNVRLAIVDLPQHHPVQRALSEIDKAVLRATDLVRRILAFSRRQDVNRAAVDAARACNEALDFLRPMLPAGIGIRREFPAVLPAIVADATQLHQVVMNLGLNAAHAIGDRGWIDVSADVVESADIAPEVGADLRPGRYVRIRFRDDGCGIPADDLHRIFDPFFTTKGIGQGTGLGLSVVHGIMKAHDGAIAVTSEPGKGACFELYFPAAVDSAIAPPPSNAPAAVGNGQTILYVDDEEALVFLVRRLLERQGYRVVGHTDPEAALQELRSASRRFDVVVSDLAMPRMSGFDLARAVRATRPDLPIVLVSGYIRPQDSEIAKELGVRALLLKPDTVDALAKVLHELFAGK